MLETILPQKLISFIDGGLDRRRLFELRLRKNKSVVASVDGVYRDTRVNCLPEWIEEILLKASKYSLYAVNEQIRAGFLGVKGGIRVGLCGQAVYEGDDVKTLKNITSLNIRFPHQVIGCAGNALKYCFEKTMLSTLIISPPGAGKTTLVRDICRVISGGANVLIIDERGEISGEADGAFSFDIGSSDVMLYCKKQFGFLNGIRSMRPDIIACDELKGRQDIYSIEEALYCGVSVIATMHAEDIGDIKNKTGLNRLINAKAFKRYVVLSDKPKAGTLKRIYDENLDVVV